MTEKLFSLPVVNQLSPYLSLRQMGELPVLVVNHPKVRAAVTLQGAQLIAWQPNGEKPVIWLSEKSAFAQANRRTASRAISRGRFPLMMKTTTACC